MAVFQWITITFYMRTEMYARKDAGILLGGEVYGAHRICASSFAILLPNCLTPLVTVHALRSGGRDLLAHGSRLSRLWLARAHSRHGDSSSDQALLLENRDKLWLTVCAVRRRSQVTLILVVFIGESVREAFDPKQYDPLRMRRRP
jgi:ABC-type microcin C transport system permease subunit YejE